MHCVGHIRIPTATPSELQQICAACARASSQVEPSDREIFVDLSAPGCKGIWRALFAEAAAIVPEASLGLATSKLVARIASDVAAARPSRLCVVSPGQEPVFLAPLPISYLWLADARTIGRLTELGFPRIGEIAAIPVGVLNQRFGTEGNTLREWSLGIDPTPVRALFPPKVLEYTGRFFEFPLSESGPLAAAVTSAAAEVSGLLEAAGCGCGLLTLRLAGSLGTQYEKQYRPHSGCLSGANMIKRISLLLLKALPVSEPLQELQLTAAELTPLPITQTGLFEGHYNTQAPCLDEALSTVQQRCGADALHVAADLTATRRDRFMSALEQLWLG